MHKPALFLLSSLLLTAAACVQPDATPTMAPQLTPTAAAPSPTPQPEATATPALPTPTSTATPVPPTPTATSTPAPTPTPTPPGNEPMLWYGSSGSPFAIQYPATWQGGQLNSNVSVYGNDTAALTITEVSLTAAGQGRLTPDEAIDQIMASFENNVDTFELIRRDKTTPEGGGTSFRVVFSATTDGQDLTGSFLAFISEQRILFLAEYDSLEEEYAALEPLINYSFGTFRTGDAADRPRQFATAIRSAADALTNGDHELAVTRYIEALEIEPSMFAVLRNRATAYWSLKDHDNALKDIERYIEAHDSDGEGYNMRALVNVFLGKHQDALRDINRALEIEGDDTYNLRDTRGFVYLKMGEWQKALDDYQAAIDGGFDIDYVRLGAGIAQAELGITEDAKTNLQDGMDLVDDTGYTFKDPQLTDLLAMADAALKKLGVTRTSIPTPGAA